MSPRLKSGCCKMLFKEHRNKVKHLFSGNFSGNCKLIILVENKYINFMIPVQKIDIKESSDFVY